MREMVDLPKTNTARIAFYGPMCSGKTWAADHIPNAKKFSFATPIKAMAKEYFDITGKSNNERKVLQQLGDAFKVFDPLVFTKYLLAQIDRFYEKTGSIGAPYPPIVVDDVRFTHEANFLRRNDFLIVEVRTNPDIVRQRIEEKYPDTFSDVETMLHPSELDWKGIIPDITIRGDGNQPVEFLIEQINDVWK